jgi:hypothetical protein
LTPRSNRPDWQPGRTLPPLPANGTSNGRQTVVPVNHGSAMPPPQMPPQVPAQQPAAQPQAAATPQPAARGQAPLPPPNKVQIGFARGQDYGWLLGQLQFSRASKTWRLRYAPLDQSDIYGGSVTLVSEVPLEKVQDGQFVLVHGRLVNPEVRTLAPAYRPESIQLGPVR